MFEQQFAFQMLNVFFSAEGFRIAGVGCPRPTSGAIIALELAVNVARAEQSFDEVEHDFRIAFESHSDISLQ
jgi:hypothetical protein